MSDATGDPNLKWDPIGARWLRWDGTQWLDNETGEVARGRVVNQPQVPTYAQPQVPTHAQPQVPTYAPGYTPPQVPQAPKQKHTGRNVALIILLAFVLFVGGCSVLVFVGAKGAVDASNKAEASASAAASASCTGKTYLDAQPANDTCADAAGTLIMDGLTISATPLAPTKTQFGGKSLCSVITISNSSGKSKDYNVFNFKIQTPNGDVATTSSIGTGQDLNSGVLVNGGTKKGAVCSSFSGTPGQYVLIYDPNPFTDPRGIWLTSVK